MDQYLDSMKCQHVSQVPTKIEEENIEDKQTRLLTKV